MMQEHFSFAPISSNEGKTIQERFEVFNRNNPWVYRKLCDLAMMLKYKGHDRIGIKMLFEVLRWEFYMQITKTDASEWKLNNNYTSRYARLLMEQEPALKGFFSTRTINE